MILVKQPKKLDHRVKASKAIKIINTNKLTAATRGKLSTTELDVTCQHLDNRFGKLKAFRFDLNTKTLLNNNGCILGNNGRITAVRMNNEYGVISTFDIANYAQLDPGLLTKYTRYLDGINLSVTRIYNSGKVLIAKDLKVKARLLQNDNGQFHCGGIAKLNVAEFYNHHGSFSGVDGTWATIRQNFMTDLDGEIGVGDLETGGTTTIEFTKDPVIINLGMVRGQEVKFINGKRK